MQLDPQAFSATPIPVVALPGMNIRLTGNVVDTVRPKLSYTGDSLHGWQYYVLEYELPASMLENENAPELVIGLEKVAVEQKTALEETQMPIHPPLPTVEPIVNSPPVQHLEDLSQVPLKIEDAERLIALMREGLVNLKDETGKFLYTCEFVHVLWTLRT